MHNAHYRKPEIPQYPIIDAQLWRESHESAQREIRPNVINKSNASRIQKYHRSNYGSSAEVQMISLITEHGIETAIKTLQNSKSIGKDGVTAEVIQQNKLWAVQTIKIILRNCQKCYSMPKQWLYGVMTFLPKKKDGSKITNSRPVTLTDIISKIWGIIMENRITPFTNLITKATQTA